MSSEATSSKYGSRKVYILEQTLLQWTGMREHTSYLLYGPKWFPSPTRGKGWPQQNTDFYVAINTFRSLFRATDSCGGFSFDKDCCQSSGYCLRTSEWRSQLCYPILHQTSKICPCPTAAFSKKIVRSTFSWPLNRVAGNYFNLPIIFSWSVNSQLED